MIRDTITATVLFSNTGKSVVIFWESANELIFGQVKNQSSLLPKPNQESMGENKTASHIEEVNICITLLREATCCTRTR